MTRIFVALLAIACLAAVPCAVWARTIKLATLAPEGTLYYEILQDMGERWREVSGGEIELRIYPGGIAGDEGDMVKKMRVGQIQAAAITGGGLADITDEIRALQMPMMFRSYEELDYVRDKIAARLDADFAQKGFRILTWGDAGWVYFFTTQPVVHPDDLKPLPVLTWIGNTTFVEVWKELGYDPVPLAATEIHVGLASGLIKAMSVPPFAALSFQWFGLADHMTDLKFAPLVGALIISESAWQRIDPALRPKLLEIAAETGRRMQEVRHMDREAVSVMQQHGLTVHEVPDNIYQLWAERTRQAYPRIMGAVVSAELVAEVKRYRDDYRALQSPP